MLLNEIYTLIVPETTSRFLFTQLADWCPRLFNTMTSSGLHVWCLTTISLVWGRWRAFVMGSCPKHLTDRLTVARISTHRLESHDSARMKKNVGNIRDVSNDASWCKAAAASTCFKTHWYLRNRLKFASYKVAGTNQIFPNRFSQTSQVQELSDANRSLEAPDHWSCRGTLGWCHDCITIFYMTYRVYKKCTCI